MDDFLQRREDGDRAPPETCDEVWEKGYKVVIEPGVRYGYKIGAACSPRVVWEGGIKYAILPPYDHDTFKAFLDQIKIYEGPDGLPSGIYTWVFYRGVEGPIRLVFTRVDTVLEIGVFHSAIVERVGAVTVHGAGELIKRPYGIAFNLESGTYTKNWLRKRNLNADCKGPDLEEKIVEEFVKAVPGAQYTHENERSFIVSPNLPFTNEVASMYHRAGFEFMEIPKEFERYPCDQFLDDYLGMRNKTPDELNMYAFNYITNVVNRVKAPDENGDKIRFRLILTEFKKRITDPQTLQMIETALNKMKGGVRRRYRTRRSKGSRK